MAAPAEALAVEAYPVRPDPPVAAGRVPGSALRFACSLRSAGYVDLFLAQVAPLGVSFVMALVSATLLGPERRGILTFLMTGSVLCGAIAYGSLHVPVVEGLRSGDGGSLRHGVRLVAAIWVVLTAVGAGLVLVTWPTRGDLAVHAGFESGLALIGGATVVTQLFAGRVLQGLGENRQYVRIVVVQSLVYLLGSGGVLLRTRSPLLMFTAWYVSVVVSLMLAVVSLRAVLRGREREAGRGRSWRHFARSAMANNLGSIGQMVMLRADVLVVGVVLGAAAAGVYGIALSLTELSLIAPEVFALSVYGNRARMEGGLWIAQVQRTFRMNSAVTILAAAGIALAAVVLAYGPLASYSGLVPLVLIILPGAFFAGYTRIALSALQALDATVPVARFGVFALVLSIGYFPGAMVGGLMGPAVVSSLAYVGTALFLRSALRVRVAGGVR